MSELNKLSDEDIITFQNGNKDAFEKIYQHYYKRIYFFVRNHVKNDALAEDVVQNTFISVCKSITSLKSPSAFHSWIMQIAYRESMRMYSRKAIPISEVEDGNIDIFKANNVKDMSDSVEDQVVIESIMKSISNLKQIYQEVAVLKYLNELSDEESAEVLDIPLGTVKSRLSKVRDFLQHDLKKDGITPQTYRMSATAIPTLLSGVFIYAEQTTKITKESTSLLKVVGGASKHTATIIKTIVGVGLIGAIVTVYLLQQPIVQQPKEIPIETAKLDTIAFNDAYTNETIELNITMSNDNYDKVLINDVETTTINENGIYTISLWRDGVMIDSKEINVSNIDRVEPMYMNYEQEGDTCYVYVSDALSGVNPNNIVYHKNDQISNDFTYDAENGVIVFRYDEYSSNIFDVYDIAGNMTTISLVSKYY